MQRVQRISRTQFQTCSVDSASVWCKSRSYCACYAFINSKKPRSTPNLTVGVANMSVGVAHSAGQGKGFSTSPFGDIYKLKTVQPKSPGRFRSWDVYSVSVRCKSRSYCACYTFSNFNIPWAYSDCTGQRILNIELLRRLKIEKSPIQKARTG